MKDGPATMREELDRPWFAFYDEGVPKHIEYPDVPLQQFLSESARKHPDRDHRWQGNSQRPREGGQPPPGGDRRHDGAPRAPGAPRDVMTAGRRTWLVFPCAQCR